MTGRKTPTLILEQMPEAAQKAITFVGGFAECDFLDRRTQATVSMALIAEHPTLSLAQIQGLRNRIAHGYREIDMSVIWDTVTNVLADLILTPSNILRNAKTGTGLQTLSSTGDS